MSVLASDIARYQSASAGSTGGAITGSSITTNVANNVFPNKNEAARVAGGTDYRKTFFKNNHATDAMKVPVIYVPVLPTNATLAIGLGVNSSDDTDSGQGNMTAWTSAAKAGGKRCPGNSRSRYFRTSASLRKPTWMSRHTPRLSSSSLSGRNT